MLRHKIGCPERPERTETFTTSGPKGAYRVSRCCDCGEQSEALVDGLVRLEPGSAEYEEAWENDPRRIVAQLSRAELEDPELNPLHPFAEPRAPSNRPTRPTIEPDMTVRNLESRRLSQSSN